MSAPADAELELFRQTVNCAIVLERMVGGWKLDVRESTKRALKYRREDSLLCERRRRWRCSYFSELYR